MRQYLGLDNLAGGEVRKSCFKGILDPLGVGCRQLVLFTQAPVRPHCSVVTGATHLHRNTITNIETGKYAGDAATLAAIELVLQRAGVEFIDENGGGPGIRLRKRQPKKG